MFHVAKRLDVVHDCRAHVETEHGWEIRWFDPGITPFAFERLDQACFFATNVSASPAMDVNLDVESGAENVTSKEIVLARFFDGAFEDFRAFRKLTSDIDVGRAGIQGETGDQDAFQQLMRILVNDVAVFERAWLRFVGVADQIDRPFFVRLDEAPFKTARKSGPTATAQPRVFDFIDNFGSATSSALASILRNRHRAGNNRCLWSNLHVRCF